MMSDGDKREEKPRSKKAVGASRAAASNKRCKVARPTRPASNMSEPVVVVVVGGVVRTLLLVTRVYPDAIVDAPNSGVEVTDTSTPQKYRLLRAVPQEAPQPHSLRNAMNKLRSTRSCAHHCAVTSTTLHALDSDVTLHASAAAHEHHTFHGGGGRGRRGRGGRDRDILTLCYTRESVLTSAHLHLIKGMPDTLGQFQGVCATLLPPW